MAYLSHIFSVDDIYFQGCCSTTRQHNGYYLSSWTHWGLQMAFIFSEACSSTTNIRLYTQLCSIILYIIRVLFHKSFTKTTTHVTKIITFVTLWNVASDRHLIISMETKDVHLNCTIGFAIWTLSLWSCITLKARRPTTWLPQRRIKAEH